MSTLKSMTGFGRAVLESGGIQWNVEISSVNRKHLDINLTLPRHLGRFDPAVRKLVGEKVFRGHVILRVSASFIERAPLKVVPNLALAKQVYSGWQAIAQAVGISGPISLSLLEKESDLFIYEEDHAAMDACGTSLLEAVKLALKPFMEMKDLEGALLEKEISSRLKALAKVFEGIKDAAIGACKRYHDKLLEKMKLLLPEMDDEDGRIVKELALFADRVDISEEIVRFQSHIEQFLSLLKSKEQAAGKKAEFLLQELSREINTIGSKAQDLEVSRKVIEIKAELEKIREQIQNVE